MRRTAKDGGAAGGASAKRTPPPSARPFVVRPMEERDLAQAGEVERDAFPTQFPPTAFRRELGNPLSRYMVLARVDDPNQPDPRLPPLPDAPPARRKGALGRFMDGARQAVWRMRNPSWQPGDDLIAGFVGMWRVADEAHVVAIGARTEYRGLGLGELLLIAAVRHAVETKAAIVTLEVRVSNRVARNLYEKYGFTERGVRKAYYSDNREDALIMTVELRGRERAFRELASRHERRWGRSEIRGFRADSG